MPTQQESNSSILAELYKYNPSALVELYEIDLTPLQEYYTSKGAPIATTKYYFHNGKTEQYASIKWGASEQVYAALPIEIDGVQASSAGEVPRPTLTVGNLDLLFTQLCRAYANLVGAKITRIRTFVKFLNSSNFPITNLLLNTEDFSLWVQDVDIDTTVTANATTAPNGTLTADKIFEATVTSSIHGVVQTFAVASSNVNVSCSGYFKASERTNVTLRFRNKANITSGKTFDLTTGTISSTTLGTVINSGIQPMGNGWYRCWIVCTSGTGATTPRMEIYVDNNSTPASSTYAGTVNSGIFVWGSQAEIITNPTNTPSIYIPVGTVAGNPTADPNAKFPNDVYTVDRMAEEIPGQITFDLAPAWDVEGVMLPRRQILANVCPWVYKKDACTWTVSGAATINTLTGTAVATTATYSNLTTTAVTGTGSGLTVTVVRTGGTTYTAATTATIVSTGSGYVVGNTVKVLGTSLGGTTPANDLTLTIASITGAKYYDANDLIVSTAAQDACGKRLNSCRLRFGSKILPFGGFPSAGLYGKPI